MRIKKWLKSLAGALALSTLTNAAPAQGPMGGDPGAFMGGPPTGMPHFQPQYVPNNPGTMWPAGTPSQFQPYPQVSPYNLGNVSRETHDYSKGLWFKDVFFQGRDYYGSVEYMTMNVRDLGGNTIGSRTVDLDPLTGGPRGFDPLTYEEAGQISLNGNNNGNVVSTLPVGRVPVDSGVFPYVFLQPGPTANALFVTIIDNNDFPIRKYSELGDFTSRGMQLNWGFENGDGTGFKTSGFFGFQDDQSFTRGQDNINGVPVTPAMVIATNGQILFTRNGAIPLFDGLNTSSTLFVGSTGGTQKYDVLYRLEAKGEYAGGNARYYSTPILKTAGVKIRPAFGAQYQYINEGFSFRGIDSGFSYVYSGSGTNVGGGTTGSPTFRPVLQNTNTLIQRYDQFEANLASENQSHLAGPTCGLRYDLGMGRGFTMWGESTFGILGNQEQLRVHGNNIGEVLINEAFNNVDMLAATSDARFNDKDVHTHVSPFFEQSVQARAPIFETIPFISQVPFLNAAQLEVGYTFTVIGEVARPSETIDWKGFPLVPSAVTNRSTWFSSKINVGLEWNW